MQKLPSDWSRYNVIKSRYSVVLISKRSTKGVYKIVYDKNTFENEVAALQSMRTSIHFTRLINYNSSELFMYIERGEVVFELFQCMVSKFEAVPYDIAASFTSDLLTALEHLHTTGLCHGDIKLENILRSDNVFKLFDMGMSCHTSEFKSGKGTMNYLSPEAFVDNVFIDGQKADIWSSGICIFASWCSMQVPWLAANMEVDGKLSPKGTDSRWKTFMNSTGNLILKSCYNNSHYFGPSFIVTLMLKINPEARSPANELISLWNVLKH